MDAYMVLDSSTFLILQFCILTTFSISKQNLMHVSHQAYQYTHLAKRSMRNTKRRQKGKHQFHRLFYAILLANSIVFYCHIPTVLYHWIISFMVWSNQTLLLVFSLNPIWWWTFRKKIAGRVCGPEKRRTSRKPV